MLFNLHIYAVLNAIVATRSGVPSKGAARDGDLKCRPP